MIQVPIELRVARAQAAGQHAGQVATQGELTSSIAFVTMAENGMIDDVTATENIDTFSPWVVGVKATVGQLRTYGGETEGSAKKLYRCVQAHTTQVDWTPDVSPSLWVEVGDPSVEYPAWSQPVGAHDSYEKGAKTSHNDKKWVSDVDDNVWEPGVYGWTEVADE